MKTSTNGLPASNGLPAYIGGEPSVTFDHDRVNKWPNLDKEDEDAVIKIIQEGRISKHPVIQDLEKDYSSFTDRKYALAHCNGTMALLASFYSIGLMPGDEVIVPSATFWASVLPMLWLGAIPIFCESEGDRLGPDPEDIEKKITSKTKAIVIVHLWGIPVKMTEIKRIAKKYNLLIIEDASHAHGATWNGIPCGKLGDISVFSLQGDKLAPGGEGGIMLCDDYSYFERAVCLGDITRIINLDTPSRRFAATSFGMKTRIAPVSAAIARIQLKKLEQNNQKRNANLVYLSNELEKMGFNTFLSPDHIKRVYFEYIIQYNPDRIPMPVTLFIESLGAEGCQISAPRYPLLHKQPFFVEGHYRDIARITESVELPDYNCTKLPKTEEINKHLLKLPVFPNAERIEIDQYILAFKKVLKYSEQIKEHYKTIN